MRQTPLATLVALGTLACAKPDPPGATPAPAPTPSGVTAPGGAASPAPAAKTAPPAQTPAPGGPRLSASREAEEACVDKWLAERGLDPYGNPEGTMYAGGTPLFDERTGEQVDRLTYVYKRQPLARAACRP